MCRAHSGWKYQLHLLSNNFVLTQRYMPFGTVVLCRQYVGVYTYINQAGHHAMQVSKLHTSMEQRKLQRSRR